MSSAPTISVVAASTTHEGRFVLISTTTMASSIIAIASLIAVIASPIIPLLI